MKITNLRMVGIRCFEDTGDLDFGGRFNIFAGENNAGKTTLLRGLLTLQGMFFDSADHRVGPNDNRFISFVVEGRAQLIKSSLQPPIESPSRLVYPVTGDYPDLDSMQRTLASRQTVFEPTRPNHAIVALLSFRRGVEISHEVSLKASKIVDGGFSSLHHRVDTLLIANHPKNQPFLEALRDVVGIPMSTTPSQSGKDVGFYFDDDTFVTRDRMGDGITEMLGHIVELCLERGKIFILEEPEMHLHPRALKALLKLVRESAEHNQFFIATHSNVVVRELAGEEDSKVFRVFRDGDRPDSPSRVEEVERTPAAHMQLLRELGYDFADFQLHDAWLFLEESSAERFIRDILIAWFVPELRGKLRTFAANGVNDVEPSVDAFRRLVVFVHLDPVYEGRIWVRVDGDAPGNAVAEKLKAKFPKANVATFEKGQFELYYPAHFQVRVDEVLAIADKQEKRKQKAALLDEVLKWSVENPEEAKAAWAQSASEPIALLREIAAAM